MAVSIPSEHAPGPRAPHDDESHDDIIYPDAIPFLLLHLASFAAIWTGVTRQALIMALVLYMVRMFGVTAGYHRYFSHRTYRTSRVFQFLLAFLAQSTAQKAALWWAAKHRHHHKHSDTEHDVHSPKHDGFWMAHVGWIFRVRAEDPNFETVEDLARYPELRWLARYEHVPTVMLAVLSFLIGGWPGLVVGFVWSTVAVYHGTFAINSLAHVVGTRRFVTGDDSRNNWWLAIITLGEGWHNNHHAFQSSTRQGFRWYEFDPTYYVLKLFSWVGLVWEIKEPPRALIEGDRRLNRRVIDKVAHQLAESFPVDGIAAQLREAWAQSSSREAYEQLSERLRAARADAEVAMRAARADAELALADLQLPHVPTVDELRQRAREMFAATPSVDEIAHRARAILVAAVTARLLDDGAAAPA